MTKKEKPYAVGAKIHGGLTTIQEYQTLGRAIDGLIRLQPLNPEMKLEVYKRVEGETWQTTSFLNHALSKFEPEVKA